MCAVGVCACVCVCLCVVRLLLASNIPSAVVVVVEYSTVSNSLSVASRLPFFVCFYSKTCSTNDNEIPNRKHIYIYFVDD